MFSENYFVFVGKSLYCIFFRLRAVLSFLSWRKLSSKIVKTASYVSRLTFVEFFKKKGELDFIISFREAGQKFFDYIEKNSKFVITTSTEEIFEEKLFFDINFNNYFRSLSGLFLELGNKLLQQFFPNIILRVQCKILKKTVSDSMNSHFCFKPGFEREIIRLQRKVFGKKVTTAF